MFTHLTALYTLSLHDALPILPFFDDADFYIADDRQRAACHAFCRRGIDGIAGGRLRKPAIPSMPRQDRKSTRLNSSHLGISYAVFCLKKKIDNIQYY